MRALDNDKLLAMNFWSLVVKITDQIDQLSAHEIGPNQPLLEAIARGVTRHSVAELEAGGGEPKWLIQQMAAMLAGEDVQIPAGQIPPAAMAPLHVQIPPAAMSPAAPIVEPPVAALTPPAQAPVSTEAPLQPFLIRSRMILEPEAAASQPSLGQRALFAPEQKQAQEKPQPSRVPLEGYGERIATGSTSTRTIAFALLMVIALSGAAFFALGEGPALQQRVATSVRASYNAAWHGVKTLSSAIHQY